MSFSRLTNIIKSLNQQSYNIGFVEDYYDKLKSMDFKRTKIHWLDWNGYKGSWFADPFILDIDDHQVTVLVEEFRNGLGRLSRLKVCRENYKLLACDPFLELPTHLSFPIYIVENGKIYIYPENYQSGKLNLYEYDSQTNKVGKPITLIDEPLLDTQIAKLDNSYYAFGVKYRDGEISDTRYLDIFKAQSLFGPYKHIQSVYDEKGQLRGAGQIFRLDGHLIRPVQNCQTRYGEETILKSLSLKDDQFSEKEMMRISPIKGDKWWRCLHTFNHKDGLIAIDGLDYNHHIWGPIYHALSTFIHKKLKF